MGAEFQANLADWGPYFGFVGTAAATLLGLLFVAASLRLDIFRNAETADVREFARLTLLSFLIPLILAGLALMPHEQPPRLAIPILVLAIIGMLVTIHMCREWIRLNPARARARSDQPWRWQGWVHMVLVGCAYLTMMVVAFLLLRGSDAAFLLLGVVEGWMLVVGTLNAWVMLTNANAAGTS
ncbi:MAG: hypothetical protein M3464_20880 [Chloroflexota bacterium]|nr:hypothetical protein [Chloroflexota bacterium]